MSVRIRHAEVADVPLIVSLLSDMQDELGDVHAGQAVLTQSVCEAVNEGVVHWFLFYEAQSTTPFGICYLQSVHNYWRLTKRFYLGGFYITPAKRGQGRFRQVYAALKDWVKANNGTQIYAHIHEDNHKSQNAFTAMGMEKAEYLFYVDDWD
jgi:RimJ/RimL family protein N-acetyltransferase